MRADLLHSLRTVTRQRDVDALQQATLSMLCDCSGARSALLFVGHEAGEEMLPDPLLAHVRGGPVDTASIATVLHAGEHDQLTGLLNRRTFEAKLAALLRLQRQLSQEPAPSDGSPARAIRPGSPSPTSTASSTSTTPTIT